MAKKPSALAGIFDDETDTLTSTPISDLPPEPRQKAAPLRRSSHPGKKPVLIHIPEDMHRVLRQLSVEPDGEPITVVTERGLRQYLVQRGYTKFAQ